MTTTYAFTVSVPTLHALLLHAATKDVRYYLQGICVDLTDPAAPILVATDGHRILTVDLVQHASRRVTDITQTGDIPDTARRPIIPRGLVAKLSAARSATCRIVLTLGDDPDTPSVQRFVSAQATHQPSGVTRVTPTIAGVYPDWRRAMPSTDAMVWHLADARLFDMRYLADAVEACVLLGLVSAKFPGLPESAGQYSPVAVDAVPSTAEADASVPRCLTAAELRSHERIGAAPWSREGVTIPTINGCRFRIMPRRI